MFPWVYGFEWHPGYLIFLGVFFTAAVVVAGTVLVALWRSFTAVRKKHGGRIYWHTSFEELTPEERRCRHAITGELPERCCDQEFDCRGCRMHARLLYSEEGYARTAEPEQAEVCGISVPLDRYYHRGHTWVREGEDGVLLVGIDDLGRASSAATAPWNCRRPAPRYESTSRRFASVAMALRRGFCHPSTAPWRDLWGTVKR